MPNRPVPNSYFTTDGALRTAKGETGVDVVPFSLDVRITKASGDAAGKHAFPVDLPPYALVDTIEIHPEGPSTIATDDSVGIGGTSDPDEYMEIAENSVDAVGENVITVANRVNPSNSAKTLYLHSTNGSGSTTGTIYGDWSIRVTGRIINPIGN